MTKEYYLIMFSGRHSTLGIPGSLPWQGIQIPLFPLFKRWTIILLHVPRLRSPFTVALYYYYSRQRCSSWCFLHRCCRSLAQELLGSCQTLQQDRLQFLPRWSHYHGTYWKRFGRHCGTYGLEISSHDWALPAAPQIAPTWKRWDTNGPGYTRHILPLRGSQ